MKVWSGLVLTVVLNMLLTTATRAKDIAFIITGPDIAADADLRDSIAGFYRDAGAEPVIIHIAPEEYGDDSGLYFNMVAAQMKPALYEHQVRFNEDRIYVFGHGYGAAAALVAGPFYQANHIIAASPVDIFTPTGATREDVLFNIRQMREYQQMEVRTLAGWFESRRTKSLAFSLGSPFEGYQPVFSGSTPGPSYVKKIGELIRQSR